MTALTLAIKAPVSFFAELGRSVALFFEGIAEGQEIARRYDELSRLSDAALAARGLSREDLPQAIVHGRIGR